MVDIFMRSSNADHMEVKRLENGSESSYCKNAFAIVKGVPYLVLISLHQIEGYSWHSDGGRETFLYFSHKTGSNGISLYIDLK